MSLKILHVAVHNVAGFPSDFVKMHNQQGDYSRLVTLHENSYEYPEDICLNLSLPKGSLAQLWRKRKEQAHIKTNPTKAHYFRPKNIFEKLYFALVDLSRKFKVDKVIRKYGLNDFDIIIYDGGLDLYRNSAQAKKWKQMGKKIVLCYYGSDLRIRGIIKEMEELADVSITAEYDHLALDKTLDFIFYPYDYSELPAKKEKKDDVIRVVHSPTNRQYKGTETILRAVERVRKERDFEFVLLENRSRAEVLEIKSQCDIGIEAVGGFMGGSGYGKSGLEMLALGMPVITSFTEDYLNWLPENPFVVANDEEELYRQLIWLLDNPQLVPEIGQKSKAWVEKYHGLESVNRELKSLFSKRDVI
ncbi:MAG: glycosyltransferase [Candidatus Cloacimonadia bacterium]